VASDVDGPWLVELIPDADQLYMRVHKRWLERGELDPGCFQDHPKKGGSMSTDWSKYASPEQTRRGGLRSGPEHNAVLALDVGAVRAIPGQIVEHAPIFADSEVPNNRAHAEVLGPKNAETRVRYLRIYRMVLTLTTE
jgi:hypothetical protein